MRNNQALAWYRRMSLVYGMGAWTVFGSMFLFGREKNKLPDKVEQKDVSPVELPEPPKGFYVETIVTYRDDFVPLPERIYNSLKSWTGGPGAES
ncbi:small integral membrane protein 26-like [Tenrec ecaudatus]|uniref:small integral membrane protein 26-like n=1 Tax=Tenrec ecaudatus TaxID=94439 RepID=UPI003F594CC8